MEGEVAHAYHVRLHDRLTFEHGQSENNVLDRRRARTPSHLVAHTRYRNAPTTPRTGSSRPAPTGRATALGGGRKVPQRPGDVDHDHPLAVAGAQVGVVLGSERNGGEGGGLFDDLLGERLTSEEVLGVGGPTG